jgi:hypothetical protein
MAQREVRCSWLLSGESSNFYPRDRGLLQSRLLAFVHPIPSRFSDPKATSHGIVTDYLGIVSREYIHQISIVCRPYFRVYDVLILCVQVIESV